MKNNVYVPLQAVKKLSEKYPGCWDMIEMLRREFKEDFPSWCFIPIGACQAITEKVSGRIDIEDSMLMAAAAAWRQSKNVYTFDLDLQNTLFSQAEEKLVLPISILDQMPYPCIYIETKELPIHGFFVHREFDVNTKASELRFYFVFPDGNGYGLTMHLLQNRTIEECMEETYHIARSKSSVLENKDVQPVTRQISLVLQLLIYLCAENADMSENPVQAKVYRRNKTVKDAYREIRKWDVGYKTGSLLRASKSAHSKNSSTAAAGSPKRPHTRRGHWSHYHVGPGRTETIVKWIAPTFINADSVNPDELPVTITKIDQKKV